jgi:hypothetical protein
MEVLLNTIWLLVAVGAFLFWRAETFAGAPTNRGHNCPLVLLSLACALVLLFPVISLTDDLHAEQAPMEDSSRSVMKARNLAHGCFHTSRFPLITTVNRALCSCGLRLVLGAIVLPDTPSLGIPPISSHQGRSPPSKI